MYWWNIKALEQDLKRGTLSISEQFKYTLAVFIVCFLSRLNYQEKSVYLITASFTLLSIIIMILGMVKAFKINKDGDQLDFMVRVVSLFWVTHIRIIVLLVLPFAFILGLYNGLIVAYGMTVPLTITTYAAGLWSLMVMTVIWTWICRIMKRISQGN